MKKQTLLQILVLLACTVLLPQRMTARDYGWPTPGEGQMWFTYMASDYEGDNTGYGSLGPDDYHVAIYIPTSIIAAGTSIEAVRFWMAARSVSNMSIWASTYLPDSEHAPDLQQTPFTYEDREQTERAGRLYDTYMYNIPFDDPVTVQGDGIYIGFSVTVDSISHRVIGGELYEYGWDGYPLAYIENGVNPFSFFLNSTTRGTWSNWGEQLGAQYMMGVLMSGSGKEYALNATGFGTVYNIKGETPKVPVTLSVLGSAGAKSIDYVVTDADGNVSEPIHIDFAQALSFGQRAEVMLPLPAESLTGRSFRSLTVIKVNGEVNESDENVAQGEIITLAERLTRKPTVEEFTATWSNKGPRGIVARERMKVNFPDQLVIIANHMNSPSATDPMALDEYFANAMPGVEATDFVPQTAINRIRVMDSYFGTTFGRNNAIRLDLNAAVQELAPASVKLTPVWDEDEAVITMTTDVNFLYSDEQATYALAYVITEDGMVGDTEDWNQQNTYSGQDWLDPSDWLIPWTEKRNSVSGVVYDDVAIAQWGIGGGIENSLNAHIEEGVTQHHTLSYDIDSNELVQDKSRLKVAVLLFNTATGEIVNAEQTRILTAEEASGISTPQLSSTSGDARQLYDLQGRRVDAPRNGLYITGGKKVLIK